jgi:hypothetical protein
MRIRAMRLWFGGFYVGGWGLATLSWVEMCRSIFNRFNAGRALAGLPTDTGVIAKK